ncbi:MAG: hypothetical protein V2J10_12820, partial [Wenzhouxiangella sp.]|nr:hypothetical protein [Wenzhouxiangella sp.]
QLIQRGAALWSEVVVPDTPGQVPEAEIYLGQLFEHESLTAEHCRHHRYAVEHYLERMPIDVGMWKTAEFCAQLLGESAWAVAARTNIDALVAHAFRDGRGLQAWNPAPVLHSWDIAELIAESGLEILWMRVMSLHSVRFLLVEVSTVDSFGRQQRRYFDLMEALVRVNFDDPALIYPAARRSLVFAALEADAIEGDPLALTGFLYIDFEQGEFSPVAARRALLRSWEAGEAGGGLMLVEMCLTRTDLDCDETLMQSLIEGLIDRDIAEGHALQALALIRAGHSIDDDQVQAAIGRAARLRDRGWVQFYLAVLLYAPDEALSPGQTEQARELLVQSAAQGHGAAALRLAAESLANLEVGDEPDPIALDYLDVAVREGLPHALYLKALSTGLDQEQGRAFLFLAAERGLPEAQFLLGALLSNSPDEAVQGPADEWLVKAGHGGDVTAMRLLAQRRLTDRHGQPDYEDAEAWLFNAWSFDDPEAAALLAALYALRPELVPESDAPGLEVARLLREQVGSEAVTLIDRVFRRVPPFSDRPEVAHALLGSLSAEGWAEASEALAERALDGLEPASGPEDVQRWYQRASAQGSVQAQNDLASYLLHDLDKPAEAVAAFREAAERGHVWAANDLAYLLCTGESGAERMPQAGLEVIEALFERQETAHPYHYSTLAACQAAQGNFEDAVKNHEIALTRTRAEEPDAHEVHRQMNYRLELYRAGRPYIWQPGSEG